MLFYQRNIEGICLLLLFFININFLFAQDKSERSTAIFEEIRNLISSNQRKEAIQLCKSVLEDKPNFFDVRVYLGRIYSWEKQYNNARGELTKVLSQRSNYKEALNAIINVEIWSGQYDDALYYINQALSFYPVNEKYLLQKAKVLEKMNKTENASQAILKLLELNPSHKQAHEFNQGLKRKTKVNTISFSHELDVFDEIFDSRHLTTVTLSRKTKYGSIIGRINIANRFEKQGFQYEIDAYPRIRSGTYAYINIGVSNASIFPSRRYGMELYQRLPQSFEASLGLRYLEFSSSNPKIITTSIGKYYKSYWFSLRAYITPKSFGTSSSFNLSIRKYLKDADNFMTLKVGMGISPDERNRLINGESIYRLESYKLSLGIQKMLFPLVKFRLNAGYFLEEKQFSLGDFLNRYNFSATISTNF